MIPAISSGATPAPPVTQPIQAHGSTPGRLVRAAAASAMPLLAGDSKRTSHSPLDAHIRKLAAGVHTSALQAAAQSDDLQGMRDALRQGADPRAVSWRGISDQAVDLLAAAERIERLCPWTDDPIDQALRRFDIAAVESELDAMSRNPAALWSAATANRAEPVLRGILAVEGRRTIRTLARAPVGDALRATLQLPSSYQGGLLHAGLHAGLHGGHLAKYLESIPHLNPGRALDLNGVDEFFCRHWSIAWLQSARLEGGADRVDYASFAKGIDLADPTREAVVNRQYDALRRCASEAYLVHDRRFGFLAYDLLAQMRPGDAKRMLALTGNHAMAVELSCEQRHGRPYYAAHFYDPNVTTVHASAYADDLTVTMQWSVSSFLQLQSMEDGYFENQDRTMGFFVVPDSGLPTSSERPPGDRRLTTCYVDDPLGSSTAVYRLAADGFDGELAGFPNRVAAMSESQAWAALNYAPGTGTVLSRVIAEGHAPVARVLGQTLDRAPLPLTQRLQLLEGCAPTMISDRQDAGRIRAFHAMLSEIRLSDVERAVLFNRLAEQPSQSLQLPLADGDALAIMAWTRLLVSQDLPDETLVRWLSAEFKGGTPGLGMAMWKGRADAVSAFGGLFEAVQSRMNPADLFRILVASTKGRPALYDAMNKGHAAAIRAYGDVVARSALPVESRRLLLYAIDLDTDLPGVFPALAGRHPEALEAYGDALAACLPFDDARRVLRGALTAPLTDGSRVFDVFSQAKGSSPTQRSLDRLLDRFGL